MIKTQEKIYLRNCRHTRGRDIDTQTYPLNYNDIDSQTCLRNSKDLDIQTYARNWKVTDTQTHQGNYRGIDRQKYQQNYKNYTHTQKNSLTKETRHPIRFKFVKKKKTRNTKHTIRESKKVWKTKSADRENPK